jgi:hypothetical protein
MKRVCVASVLAFIVHIHANAVVCYLIQTVLPRVATGISVVVRGVYCNKAVGNLNLFRDLSKQRKKTSDLLMRLKDFGLICSAINTLNAINIL